MYEQKPTRTPKLPEVENSVSKQKEILSEPNLAKLNLPVITYDHLGVVKSVNSAWLRLTGFQSKELIGYNPPYPFQPGVTNGKTDHSWLISRRLNKPCKVISASNNPIWVLVNRIVYKVSGMLNTVEIWTDVTAFIEKEASLKRDINFNKNNFKRFFNALPIPVAINDLPDFNFVDINRSFLKTVGVKRGDLIGKTSKSLPNAPLEHLNFVNKNISQHNKVFHKEIKLITPSGKNRTNLFYTQAVKMNDQDYAISVSLDITERKLMEEALRESEKFKSSLMAASTNPIMVLNPDGSIHYVNPALEKLTGYTAKELIGTHTPYPWWPEQYRNAYLQQNLNINKNNSSILDRECVSKKGETFWIAINASQIWEKGQIRYSLSIWTDITERKRAETALKENESYLFHVLQDIPNPLLIIDPNFGITYVNQAFEKISGYQREEVIGLKPPHPWWRPDDVQRYMFESLPEFDFDVKGSERKYLNKMGRDFWVSVNVRRFKLNNEKVQVMSNWFDISERRAAEEALKTSEAFSSSLINDSPTPILVTDGDNRIQLVNPAFEKMTGYNNAELVGRGTPYPWWPASKENEYMDEGRRNTSREIRTFERQCIAKSGRIFWMSITLRRILETGRVNYNIGICLDITEQKAAREALQESEAFNRRLLEDAPNPILVSNPDLTVRFVNRAFENMTGFTREEVIGIKKPFPW